MKKILSFALCLTLILSSMSFSAMAATKPITVKLDGNAFKFPDQKPYATLLQVPMFPVSAIAKALGYKYTSTAKGYNVKISKGKEVITFKVGTKKMTIGGKVKTFKYASTVKNARTCVTKEMLQAMFPALTLDYVKNNKLLNIYTKVVDGDPKTPDDPTAPLYTRVWNTGNYEYFDNSRKAFGNAISLKGTSYKEQVMVYIAEDLDEPYELLIDISEPTIKNREVVKEILKMAYPTSYEKAYELMMKVFREELYTLKEIPTNMPGTKTYLDGRYFRAAKNMYLAGKMTVVIGTKNVKYTELPACPDSEIGFPIHSQNLEGIIQEYGF